MTEEKISAEIIALVVQSNGQLQVTESSRIPLAQCAAVCDAAAAYFRTRVQDAEVERRVAEALEEGKSNEGEAEN